MEATTRRLPRIFLSVVLLALALHVRGTRFARRCRVIREVSLTPSIAPTVTDADELFVNLDGSVFETPNGRWSVEVCGIHSYDARNWVQLCLRSDTSYGLTVRVEQLSASQVRSAVSRWLSSVPC